MTLSETIDGFLQKSDDLRSGLEQVLTYTSPEDVKDEIHKRNEFKANLRKLTNELSDRIGEMERLKRKIGLARTEQTTDIRKLDDYKWDLISERKHAN